MVRTLALSCFPWMLARILVSGYSLICCALSVGVGDHGVVCWVTRGSRISEYQGPDSRSSPPSKTGGGSVNTPPQDSASSLRLSQAFQASFAIRAPSFTPIFLPISRYLCFIIIEPLASSIVMIIAVVAVDGPVQPMMLVALSTIDRLPAK